MYRTNEDVGSGSIMGVLFIIIVIWAIFGGGFGGDRYGRGGVPSATETYSKQVCDAEKQEIIDAARTQYLIETTGNKTVEANNLNTQRLYDQSARQYEAGLQAQLFDFKLGAMKDEILTGQKLQGKDAEIMSLRAQIYADDKFNILSLGQRDIECKMLKAPLVYGQGATPLAQAVPLTVPTNSCFC